MLEWKPDRAEELAVIPLAGAVTNRRTVVEAFRGWLATDLEPHAHDDRIHAHTWGRQRHTHGGTRWGR